MRDSLISVVPSRRETAPRIDPATSGSNQPRFCRSVPARIRASITVDLVGTRLAQDGDPFARTSWQAIRNRVRCHRKLPAPRCQASRARWRAPEGPGQSVVAAYIFPDVGECAFGLQNSADGFLQRVVRILFAHFPTPYPQFVQREPSAGTMPPLPTALLTSFPPLLMWRKMAISFSLFIDNTSGGRGNGVGIDGYRG